MKKTNPNLIKAWIAKGQDDLSFAKVAFKETNFYDHICVLAHQAIEKHLKAVLLSQNGKLAKNDRIHNLNILAQKCSPSLNLQQFNKDLRVLSQAYLPARYPDETYIKAFTKEEARKCLQLAGEIAKFVEKSLKI